MDFGIALEWIRQGKRVQRDSWNGKGQWLQLVPARPESPDNLAYIEIKTVQNKLVPWVASQTDLLAFDWEVLS